VLASTSGSTTQGLRIRAYWLVLPKKIDNWSLTDLQHRFSTKNSNMHRAPSSSLRVRIETRWRATKPGQPQKEEEEEQ
jgi:hypothetical protein